MEIKGCCLSLDTSLEGFVTLREKTAAGKTEIREPSPQPAMSANAARVSAPDTAL
jgi:hypothetical protein